MDGSPAGDCLHQIHQPTEPLQRLKGVGLEISTPHQRHERLTEQQPYAVVLRFLSPCAYTQTVPSWTMQKRMSNSNGTQYLAFSPTLNRLEWALYSFSPKNGCLWATVAVLISAATDPSAVTRVRLAASSPPSTSAVARFLVNCRSFSDVSTAA